MENVQKSLSLHSKRVEVLSLSPPLHVRSEAKRSPAELYPPSAALQLTNSSSADGVKERQRRSSMSEQNITAAPCVSDTS